MYDMADSVILEQVSKGSILWVSAENFMKSFTDTLKLNYSYIENDFSLKKVLLHGWSQM